MTESVRSIAIECLRYFCRSVRRWPRAEHAADRMGFVRMVSAILAAEATAAHYLGTIQGYLLVSGEKPAG